MHCSILIEGARLALLGRVNYAGGTVTVNSVRAQLSPDLIFAATGIPFTLGTNALDTVFVDPFGRSTNRQTSAVVSQKAYGYDANGNLTNDGRMAYFWNDENRLVAVRDAKTGALIQENRYDGLGRRRERIQSSVAGGDDPGSTNRYLYQNWLVLGVTDGEGNVLETYTHGADLSGQVGGGAGGIGGILASTQAGGPAYYHVDFNGNIIQVSGSNQTQLAKYAYSPFGEVLLKEGAFDSRYQFSTKEYDACTGLNYYGYRFYSPGLGRWPNRDIFEEWGAVNIYCFLNGQAENAIDSLGGWVLNTQQVIQKWTFNVPSVLRDYHNYVFSELYKSKCLYYRYVRVDRVFRRQDVSYTFDVPNNSTINWGQYFSGLFSKLPYIGFVIGGVDDAMDIANNNLNLPANIGATLTSATYENPYDTHTSPGIYAWVDGFEVRDQEANCSCPRLADVLLGEYADDSLQNHGFQILQQGNLNNSASVAAAYISYKNSF